MTICLYCKAAPADLGRYCSGCYGREFHADGSPLVLGDPGDPWSEFNDEADRCIADAKLHAVVAPRMAAQWFFPAKVSAWKLRPKSRQYDLIRKESPAMTTSTQPPYPQDPAHGNGTCEQCGQPCAVCGPRWCPACYYLPDGRPRDQLAARSGPSERWLPDFDKLPPLTDAKVSAGARPGESWEAARVRLEADNYALPPMHYDSSPGADYTLAGPVDEYANDDEAEPPLPVTTPGKAPDPAELGQRLLALRRANNWTLNQAVAALGVNVPASRWHLWENGHARPVREQIAAVEALLASAGL